MATIFINGSDVQPLLQGQGGDAASNSSREGAASTSRSRPAAWLSWLWRAPAPTPAQEPPATPLSTSPQPHDPLLTPATASPAGSPSAAPAPAPGPVPIPRPLSSHTIPIPSSASSSTSSAFPLSLPLRAPSTPSTPSPPSSPSARLLARSPTRSSQASLTPTRSSESGPQCLICLETLTQEDFDSGEAMYLECLCKGDNALRHRSCALRWIEMRGTRICELCKTPIGNLPEPPPRPPSPTHQLVVELNPPLEDVLDSVAAAEHTSAVADQVFDCIRVMWVTMIIGILWFQMPVGVAFLVGMVVGALYCGCCYLLHRYCQPQHNDPMFQGSLV